MPITHDLHPRSFLTKIASYEKVCSIHNSMTVLDGPTGLLGLFLKMGLAGYTGCYNGCNPGVMSHDEVLSRYRERVDPGFTWTNFTLEEQAAVLAAGRSNNRLDARKLQGAAEALGFRLLPLPAAVEEVMASIATARETSNASGRMRDRPRQGIASATTQQQESALGDPLRPGA